MLLLRLADRLTTFMASLGGLRFRPKGFGYYAQEYVEHRKGVLAGLYQKRLMQSRPDERENGTFDVYDLLSEFNSLNHLMAGEGRQKRITFVQGVTSFIRKSNCLHDNIDATVGYRFDGYTEQGFSYCPDCHKQVYQGDIACVMRDGPKHLPFNPAELLDREHNGS